MCNTLPHKTGRGHLNAIPWGREQAGEAVAELISLVGGRCRTQGEAGVAQQILEHFTGGVRLSIPPTGTARFAPARVSCSATRGQNIHWGSVSRRRDHEAVAPDLAQVGELSVPHAVSAGADSSVSTRARVSQMPPVTSALSRAR